MAAPLRPPPPTANNAVLPMLTSPIVQHRRRRRRAVSRVDGAVRWRRAPVLADHIRQQREEPGAFDGARQLTLLGRRDRRDAARHDLAALRDEPLQQLEILIVDCGRVGAGKWAALAPAEKRASAVHGLTPAPAEYPSARPAPRR